MNVGDSCLYREVITAEMIERFAEASGDYNPIHLDDAAAREAGFKWRIAHGMLVASIISCVLGQEFPGPGTVYLGQTLSFKRPVFMGDAITVRVEVKAIRSDKPIAILATTCTTDNGQVVLEGEATVKYREKAA